MTTTHANTLTPCQDCQQTPKLSSSPLAGESTNMEDRTVAVWDKFEGYTRMNYVFDALHQHKLVEARFRGENDSAWHKVSFAIAGIKRDCLVYSGTDQVVPVSERTEWRILIDDREIFARLLRCIRDLIEGDHANGFCHDQRPGECCRHILEAETVLMLCKSMTVEDQQ